MFVNCVSIAKFIDYISNNFWLSLNTSMGCRSLHSYCVGEFTHAQYHWNIVGGTVSDDDMAEGWVSEEETSADKLSAAIQGGNENEFIRLLKSETSDLQNFRDSVSNCNIRVSALYLFTSCKQ